MKTFLAYLKRFGLSRGFRFYRVARRCDHDPGLLPTWASHYRALASRELRHENTGAARAYMAFAEMLQTTYSRVVLKREPRRRPILNRQQRRIERQIRRWGASNHSRN